jgi:hydrogenase expression/formation protein HypC
MCLAIPGKVLKIDRAAQPLMGTVSFGGIEKSICLEWLPDVELGEYVLVHVGFAISKIDEREALETLNLFDEIEEASEKPQISQVANSDDQEHPNSSV